MSKIANPRLLITRFIFSLNEELKIFFNRYSMKISYEI